MIEERGKAILGLIQSRGGIGQEFSHVDFKKENKLSYLAWKRWQKRIDKAKEKCKPWIPSDTPLENE